MGTDNLFRRRKAKKASDLKRRKSAREAYAKILIVCEGEKTEPFYFNDARNYYGLNTVNVEVRGDCNSDPMSIVNFAKQRYKEEQDAGDPFDKVFCVFDRDEHHSYQNALLALSSLSPRNTYFSVNSVPSFEYWLLLHFNYSTRPYLATSERSAGQQALQELRTFMPEYNKAQQTLFSQLIDQLEFAKSNAQRILKENERNATDNPSTKIHELVIFLQDLKK